MIDKQKKNHQSPNMLLNAWFYFSQRVAMPTMKPHSSKKKKNCTLNITFILTGCDCVTVCSVYTEKCALMPGNTSSHILFKSIMLKTFNMIIIYLLDIYLIQNYRYDPQTHLEMFCL